MRRRPVPSLAFVVLLAAAALALPAPARALSMPSAAELDGADLVGAPAGELPALAGRSSGAPPVPEPPARALFLLGVFMLAPSLPRWRARARAS